MKNLSIGFIAIAMLFGFSAPSVSAKMVDDPSDGFVKPENCEEQNARFDAQMAKKAGVHANLNSNQAVLLERMDLEIGNGYEYGVDPDLLKRAEAARVQVITNQTVLEAAYQRMLANWQTYAGQACYLEKQDWVAGISYTNTLAQSFEAAGKTSGLYLEAVVRPIMEDLTEANFAANQPTSTK
ncbi:MAG: hypothetical protein AAB865_00010 [Patescibacteria group bacterium]